MTVKEKEGLKEVLMLEKAAAVTILHSLLNVK